MLFVKKDRMQLSVKRHLKNTIVGTQIHSPGWIKANKV